MAKFIYRMQNILDIKMKLEQTAKQEYSEARRRLAEEEEKLQVLKTRKEEYYQAYQNSIQGRLDFLMIEENANAMDVMDILIAEQSEAVKKRSKELELARQKMEREMRERKMHEKLKEKKFLEFLRELNAEEKRETDEVAGYQFMSAKTNE
ncbi:MAG: flagellar export protein FliJ [Wujia sp.]